MKSRLRLRGPLPRRSELPRRGRPLRGRRGWDGAAAAAGAFRSSYSCRRALRRTLCSYSAPYTRVSVLTVTVLTCSSALGANTTTPSSSTRTSSCSAWLAHATGGSASGAAALASSAGASGLAEGLLLLMSPRHVAVWPAGLSNCPRNGDVHEHGPQPRPSRRRRQRFFLFFLLVLVHL